MHDDPGTQPPAGGVAHRQRRARQRLTSAARRLTAEHGLAGFTVQELCDGVGVSRRTFFNYFSSKDDAVLGFAKGVDEGHVAAFMAGRASGAAAEAGAEAGAATVDPGRLIDDLAALAVAHFDEMGLTPDDTAEFIAALQREPALLPALVRSGQAEQQRFVALVVEREGLTGERDRALADVAVAIVGSLVRLSADAFFVETNTRPFDEILRSTLATAKRLLNAEQAPTRANTQQTNPSQPKDLVTTP
ncbi:TetR/AcrR family transcriptional regulator [Subtercola vilae]|uniref:TetR/AcrR family transcriptional regulator n=1 Tax=Subtercola vilae TaxID=2056433 RepID=A0A4T2C4K5_9MICO|nr:TetR/AcrR family transcriptional regulator [Subtercola vilae]TIH39293.1 TetR/AcrR family transcriptional regulator [Subtercola vilae]